MPAFPLCPCSPEAYGLRVPLPVDNPARLLYQPHVRQMVSGRGGRCRELGKVVATGVCGASGAARVALRVEETDALVEKFAELLVGVQRAVGVDEV